MIVETLLIVYAVGVFVGAMGFGLTIDDEGESDDKAGVFITVALIPGINLVAGGWGLGEFIRKRSA
jgi:hypothetical protein